MPKDAPPNGGALPEDGPIGPRRRVSETHTGTPQGGILSPLLANNALSVLDEHLHGPWRSGGSMALRNPAMTAGTVESPVR